MLKKSILDYLSAPFRVFELVLHFCLFSCTSPLAKKRKLEIDMDVNSTTGTKVFSFPSGMALSNKRLSKLINVLKPTIKQLVEDSNIVRHFSHLFYIYSLYLHLM